MLKDKLYKEFQNKGFCIIKDFFSKNELEKINYALNNIIYKISDSKKFEKIKSLDSVQFKNNFDKLKSNYPSKAGAIYDTVQTSLALQSLLTSKKIIKILCFFLDLKNETFILNFFKSIRLDLPKKDNHLLSWHQDFMDTSKKNFDYSKGITIWAPLNKVNKTNGSMELCIGSQKKRVGIISKKRKNINASEYLDIDKKVIKKYKKEIINCNRGDVVIMNMNCIHRSVSGKSNILRKTIISRYIDINSNGFVPGAIKFTPSSS